MTNPGTVAGSLPRSEDWIAREIAAIQRRLRHLRAGGLVVTGDSSGDGSTSITSTATGAGTSVAAAPHSIAVGDTAIIASTSDGSVLAGYQAFVEPGSPDSAVCGREASSDGVGGAAFGAYSSVIGDHGLAAGYSTVAGAGSVAMGTNTAGVGAVASGSNEIVLGTTSHTLEIPGKFLLRDSLGQTWQLVVDTSGTLSTVAYP